MSAYRLEVESLHLNSIDTTMASNPDEVTLYLSREMLAFNSENTDSFVSDRSVQLNGSAVTVKS